jgi:hypothetical protein
MKKYPFPRQAIILALTVFIASGVFFSCNGTPTGGGGAGSDYTLQAYVIGDLERDTSLIRVRFLRDGVSIPGGPVSLDTFLLSFDIADSLFKSDFGPANTLGSGPRAFTAFDGASEVTAESITLVGSLAMNIAAPANRQYTATDGAVIANLTSPSANSAGYALGIVKAGEEYTGSGYAEFFSLADGAGVIPPEFFRDSLNSDSLLVGTYYLYMYSYNGAPQIDSRTSDLPTVLPVGGFTPNLSTANLSGSVGSIVVSLRDTIVVTDTP